MKHQQVSVDYWAMGKAMLTYGALTALVWLMLRLFNTVFNLPRRMRAQQENIQNSLKELQKRFPDLNLTEEDLKNAEKELEELTREEENEKQDRLTQRKNVTEDNEPEESEESKKTI